MNWQPIESAPKQKWVLLWWPELSDFPFVARKDREWECSCGDEWPERDYGSPAHWMPLPEPPSE